MEDTKIVWHNIDTKRYLKFVFEGHFSEEQALPAIEKWRKLFSEEVPEGQKVNIIWDCLAMTGFEPKVKTTWQKILKELSPKIQDIWIVSTNPMIRVAALTMGLFSNYKIKTAINESYIK